MLELLRKVKKEVEKVNGRKVVYITAFGSQVTGLAHKDSDLDVMAVVLPTFSDLTSEKFVSSEYKIEVEEEVFDTKCYDLRQFHKLMLKTNVDMLQTMYSDIYLVEKGLEDFFNVYKTEKFINRGRKRLAQSLVGASFSRLNREELKEKDVLNTLRYFKILEHLSEGITLSKESFVVSHEEKEKMMEKSKSISDKEMLEHLKEFDFKKVEEFATPAEDLEYRTSVSEKVGKIIVETLSK